MRQCLHVYYSYSLLPVALTGVFRYFRKMTAPSNIEYGRSLNRGFRPCMSVPTLVVVQKSPFHCWSTTFKSVRVSSLAQTSPGKIKHTLSFKLTSCKIKYPKRQTVESCLGESMEMRDDFIL